MSDFQRLLDTTFPFVEELLMENGEFYPLAAAIKVNGEIAQVGTYFGDDFPSSDDVLAKLKEAFVTKAKDYKAVAIFYDVRVVDDNTNQNTDAVAIFIEDENDSTAYTFYYPYHLTQDRKIVFSEAWKTKRGKEIFPLFP